MKTNYLSSLQARLEEADSRLVEIQEECLDTLKKVVLAAAQSCQEDRVISGVHEVSSYYLVMIIINQHHPGHPNTVS